MQLLNLDLPSMSQIMRERRARERDAHRLHNLEEVRSFLAARRNRLNRGWSTLQTAPQADVYRGLRAMRARMRWLAKNSDLFKKYLSLWRNNVAGPYGMTLQVTAGNEAQN